MPPEVFNSNYQFLQRAQLLSFEEILRVVQIFSRLGVRKIRLTGGEPLVRKSLEVLVKEIRQVAEIEDLGLTTNASLLDAKMARKLKSAGLPRITISLDALDDEIFQQLNNTGIHVQQVLQGIDHALAAGLSPIKINMVVKRDVNLSEVMPLVRYFRNTNCILRFIEYMDVGTTNQWQLDEVVPAADLVDMIDKVFPIEPIEANYQGEVAKRWRYLDGAGEIGFITSVTQPFCSSCSRIRMSADGSLYTCLFAAEGHDLREQLRSGSSDTELLEWISNIWHKRDDRYSELRQTQVLPVKKVEMSHIGG